MPRVLFVQSFVKSYRLPFFDRLHEALQAEGIEMLVAYGMPETGELSKGDTAVFDRPWGVRVKNSWLFGGRLLYQPVWKMATGSDLVVVEQANKNLMNWPLLMGRRFGNFRFAFWGHGQNRRAVRKSLSESIKRRTLGWPDSWFAYTQGVADYLVRQGVAPEIVTSVQNSVDTITFQTELDRVSDDEIKDTRRLLGLNDADPLGLYCGSLHLGKKIDFLLETVRRVRAGSPNFKFAVIGGGPEAPRAKQAADEGLVYFPGPLFGKEKAVWFRSAQLLLNPALVGLSILDAFCAGLPLIAADFPGHGPEIEYLENGNNGLITHPDIESFASAVTALLGNSERLKEMSREALKSAEIYTLEAMVGNFREGILRCLEARDR